MTEVVTRLLPAGNSKYGREGTLDCWGGPAITGGGLLVSGSPALPAPPDCWAAVLSHLLLLPLPEAGAAAAGDELPG